MKNINVFSNESDPVLLPDSQYPEWIWQARGPCRAALRSQELKEEIDAHDATVITEKLSKLVRNQNRERIRQNNQSLKGASQ